MQQRSSLIPAESKALPQAEDEAFAQAELFALKQRSSEIPSESRAFSQADDEQISKQQLLLDALVAEQNYKGSAVAKADLLALKQRSAVIPAESWALSQAYVEQISKQQMLLDDLVAKENFEEAAVAQADLLALEQRSPVIPAESRALSQADVEHISKQQLVVN